MTKKFKTYCLGVYCGYGLTKCQIKKGVSTTQVCNADHRYFIYDGVTPVTDIIYTTRPEMFIDMSELEPKEDLNDGQD